MGHSGESCSSKSQEKMDGLLIKQVLSQAWDIGFSILRTEAPAKMTEEEYFEAVSEKVHYLDHLDRKGVTFVTFLRKCLVTFETELRFCLVHNIELISRGCKESYEKKTCANHFECNPYSRL